MHIKSLVVFLLMFIAFTSNANCNFEVWIAVDVSKSSQGDQYLMLARDIGKSLFDNENSTLSGVKVSAVAFAASVYKNDPLLLQNSFDDLEKELDALEKIESEINIDSKNKNLLENLMSVFSPDSESTAGFGRLAELLKSNLKTKSVAQKKGVLQVLVLITDGGHRTPINYEYLYNDGVPPPDFSESAQKIFRSLKDSHTLTIIPFRPKPNKKDTYQFFNTEALESISSVKKDPFGRDTIEGPILSDTEDVVTYLSRFEPCA
ncbi:MAG: VWA domain-containing protein [Bdellovibrionales bacterium]|nr:VWA domain-containing protein [Bdellovibrionales bacterium]